MWQLMLTAVEACQDDGLYVVAVRSGLENRLLVVPGGVKFDSFVVLTGRLFGHEGATKEEFVVGYVDDDGDYITVGSDAELKEAIASLSILKRSVVFKSGKYDEEKDKRREEKERMEKERMKKEKKEMKEKMKKEKKDTKAMMKKEKNEAKMEAKKERKLEKLQKRNAFLTKREEQIQQQIEKLQTVKANLERRQTQTQTQLQSQPHPVKQDIEKSIPVVLQIAQNQQQNNGKKREKQMARLKERREFLENCIAFIEGVSPKSDKMIEKEADLRRRLMFVTNKLKRLEEEKEGSVMCHPIMMSKHTERLEQRMYWLQQKLARVQQQQQQGEVGWSGQKKERKEQKLQMRLANVSEKLWRMKEMNANGGRKGGQAQFRGLAHLHHRRQALARKLEEVNRRLGERALCGNEQM